MAKIKTFIAVAALALAVGVAPSYVSADTAKDKAAEGACTAGGGTYTSGTATTPGKCVGGNSDTDKNNINTTISAIVNTALFLVGTISVIMIIYGGIKYSTSAGDS
ncbi:MAG: hypothetical protein LBL84_00800, partial [Candidatus Nomurabacteria bacterium]|nr:hypothetical protein [Candidatus Nomurabacteria bacterium]